GLGAQPARTVGRHCRRGEAVECGCVQIEPFVPEIDADQRWAAEFAIVEIGAVAVLATAAVFTLAGGDLLLREAGDFGGRVLRLYREGRQTCQAQTDAENSV